MHRALFNKYLGGPVPLSMAKYYIVDELGNYKNIGEKLKETMTREPLNFRENFMNEEIPSDSSIEPNNITKGLDCGKPFDVVEKPEHYNKHSVEAIDIIELVSKDAPNGFSGYLIGNVIKYVYRCWYKGRSIEDLKKAQWYLNRLIKHLENNDS